MDEQTVPPGRRRLAAAFRAGLRPRARWLEAGVACLTAALGFELWGTRAAERAADWLAGRIDPAAALQQAVLTWLILLGAAAGVALLVAVGTRSLGHVEDRPGDRLPGGIRAPGTALLAVLGLSGLVAAAMLAPVVAGASRAVDATEASLVLLWTRWGTHLLGTAGVLLIGAGIAEHLLMRRSLWRDLHLTPAQAREDARRDQGPRG
jgi:hypothetical protein